jgi:hypothetical protein
MTSSPLTFLGALVVESLVGKVQLLGARIQDFSSDVAADRRTVVARFPATLTSRHRADSRVEVSSNEHPCIVARD